MASNHRQSMQVNASLDQVLNILRNPMFCSTFNYVFCSENPSISGLWIVFNHGTTFTSWGENITVTLTSLSPQSCLVDVYSECSMPTQIIDWGVNSKNVRGVLDYINRQLYFLSQQNFTQNNFSPRYCRNCGNQLSNTAAFCPSCGEKQC